MGAFDVMVKQTRADAAVIQDGLDAREQELSLRERASTADALGLGGRAIHRQPRGLARDAHSSHRKASYQTRGAKGPLTFFQQTAYADRPHRESQRCQSRLIRERGRALNVISVDLRNPKRRSA
jgi:hypothetical protein